MNEFTAKKLGELLAFATVGRETFEREKSGMEASFGVERVAQILRDNLTHSEAIRKIGHESGRAKILEETSAETIKKLIAMREMYLSDLTHNKSDKLNSSTELLEWCGFFEGAATVHWAVMVGAAESLLTAEQNLTHDDLILLANSGAELHYGILHEATENLHKVGAEKAVETPKVSPETDYL